MHTHSAHPGLELIGVVKGNMSLFERWTVDINSPTGVYNAEVAVFVLKGQNQVQYVDWVWYKEANR